MPNRSSPVDSIVGPEAMIGLWNPAIAAPLLLLTVDDKTYQQPGRGPRVHLDDPAALGVADAQP